MFLNLNDTSVDEPYPAADRLANLMRIATWNVNSLKARLEKVSWWLERARPDVLLMQETKLADAEAPVAVFRDAGYELVVVDEDVVHWCVASRCMGVSPLRPMWNRSWL